MITWAPFDRKLRKRLHPKALMAGWALEILDDSICRGCGQSSLLSYKDFAEGEYETRVVTCFACEPLEAAAADESRKLGKGEKRYLLDLHDDPHDEPPTGA